MLWRVTVQRENKPVGFSPQEQQSQNGDALFWVNQDHDTEHQPVPDSGAWNIPVIGPGASSDELQLSTGTFPYHCAKHPDDEKGTLIVAVAVLIAAGADPLFGPTNAKVGQYVSWGNSDAQAHQPALIDGPVWCPPIQPGDLSKPVLFSAAGTYNYHCWLHPDNPAETGTITVK